MNENHALVSIIVPVYGTEKYLPACIDSLCNQTYPYIEVILVDDQSPDNCPAICDAYAEKDARVKVIHQKNKGVSGARNTGMDVATGEFITFVDSDDELYPEAIELLVKDAMAYGADVVSALKKTGQMGQAGQISERAVAPAVFCDEEAMLLSLAGERNTYSACAKLFRALFIRDISFSEGKNIHEDGFFLFQCYIRKPLLVQHDVYIYQYNTREGSGSRESFSDKYLAMLYFCEKKKEIISVQYPQYIEQACDMEVRTHLQLLQVLCRTTDKKYRELQKQCTKTVRKLHKYHHPVNSHLKKLEGIVLCGLFPLYKKVIRIKYYR